MDGKGLKVGKKRQNNPSRISASFRVEIPRKSQW